jgi:hypothetical protein
VWDAREAAEYSAGHIPGAVNFGWDGPALGFRAVKVYEPAWLGYAGMLTAPAENEVFVNVGSLNSKIANLENQVKSLEEELAKLKGQRR